MAEELTVLQLQEWMDYYALEPWGSEAAFLRSGIIASTIVNMSPARKPGSRAVSPKDFMLQPETTAPKGLDPARIRAELIAAFGDRVKFKPKKTTDAG